MTERHRILLDLIRRQEQFKLRVRRPLDPKVMKYIEEGKPFVAINDDGVLCLLCGKHLKHASRHFSDRHGIPGHRGMPHHERLILYGLAQGARLSSLALRDWHRTDNLENPRGIAVSSPWEGAGKTQLKHSDLPRSDRQIEFTAETVARARQQRKCPECGALFLCRISEIKKYCSARCAYKSNGKKMAMTRKVMYWNRHGFEDRAKYHPEIICGECGKVFRARIRLTRPDRPRYCSKQCAGKAVYKLGSLALMARHRHEMAFRTGTCLECGTLFTHPVSWIRKFCNYHCAAIYRGRQKTAAGTRRGNCARCGKAFVYRISKPAKFCNRRCWAARREH